MTISKRLIKLTHSLWARQTRRWAIVFVSALCFASFTASSKAWGEDQESAKLLPCSLLSDDQAPGHWHPMDQSLKRESVAILVPGLNLKLSKLNSIASLYSAHASEAFIVELKFPAEKDSDVDENWREQVHHALCMVQRRAQSLGVTKIHALGYSLGALSLLDTQNSRYRVTPTTLTLISPALYERFFPSLIKLIDWIPFGSLPSFNLKDYRLRAFTSLETYRELRRRRDHFFSNLEQVPSWPATIVFMSPDDELLDFEKTKEFSEKRNWSFFKLTPKPTNERTIHHLIVDPPSMGREQFEFFAQELGKHIDL